MAFPLHTDSYIGSITGVDPASPGDLVDLVNLVRPGEDDLKVFNSPVVDVDSAGERDRLGGNLDDGVLEGATGGEQLQLALLGVLPELAAMHQLPEREAAYARAAGAENTLRG